MRKRFRTISAVLLIISLLISFVFSTIITVESAENEHSSVGTTYKTQLEAVSWAKSQVGYQIGDGWCSAYASSYIEYLTGSPLQLNGKDYAYTYPAGWTPIQYYQGFVPQPGDLVVYDYSEKAWVGGVQLGHVGIIVSADASSFTSLEQNVSGYYVQYCYDRTYNNSNLHVWGVVRPDFSKDTSAPTISNARAENMSANSFDIKCDLNDDVGVTRVWLNIYGPSGQNGYEVAASNGAFSHRISTQGYGGAGLYSVHIYAFDAAGHQTSAAVNNIQAINDTVAPTITNAKAINPSASEFTITCQLNDNVGVKRVYVIVYSPDGTQNNGYDVAASNGTFSHTIKTAQYGGAGVYKVHLYAFDSAGNQAPCAINNIEAVNDTTAPTITDAKAINVSGSEFTITCQLNDNVGVTRVYVIVYSPDGTQNNGYDVSATNGTFSHTIKTAQYGGLGVYKVHLYAFDAAGNQAPCAINNIVAKNDAIPPEITEAKAINMSASEFTISCQLNDNIGVTRVYVIVYSPDGTQNNGYNVSASNGTFTHTIKTAQYGGSGVYNVHLYAFDAEGNQAPCAINNIVAKNDAIPPEITEAKAINTSASEFTISCRLNDNVGVTRVYVIVYNPDGTQNNGYDVSASNGTFSHTIKTANYAGEGVYKVHLYAFDAEGNQAPCAINNIYAYNHTPADTNLDGQISIGDVTTIQRYLTKAITFTDEQLAVADTNGDGKVDINDATYLQMYLARYGVTLGISAQ